MMRKTIAFFLTLALLAVLGGCASSSATKASEGTKAVSAAAPSGGKAPDGNPPGGKEITSFAAAYSQKGGEKSLSGASLSTDKADTSAVVVEENGVLTLENAAVRTGGPSSDSDGSSFYGLNAGVLAVTGARIRMAGGSVTTTGSGANGVFANGKGSLVVLEDLTIDCTGKYAHAVMATRGGALQLRNVAMKTSGANSGAVATDRGSGAIGMTGGSVLATGADSPGIYSTGAITVTGAKITATGAEAAVIEGSNSITLRDSELSTSKAGSRGVMIYQSFSGDAEGSEGAFSMTGGSLRLDAADGPLFYVTNAMADIRLSGVQVSAGSGLLLRAAADRWGRAGSNGGSGTIRASGQSLRGDLTADALSSVSLVLADGSALAGAVNPDGKAKAASVSLDGRSSWKAAADSWVTVLEVSDGLAGLARIEGGGHVVHYKASANSWLEGRTYELSGGGSLTPF